VALQAGLQAAVQTLSGHPDQRPRAARLRVDAGGNRDGTKG
jgi:hypothetical protein